MTTDRIIGVLTLLLAAVYLYATAQIPTLEIGDAEVGVNTVNVLEGFGG